MEQEDRRIRRSRRLLKQALLELVSEKPYGAVTIRDITNQADIGYATFFRHYDGKDDLMLEIFTEIVEELESLSAAAHEDEDYFENEGLMLFRHVSENQALYKSILESHAFSRKFREHFTGIIQAHIDNHAEYIHTKDIPNEVIALHMVSSLLGLIDWWLANKMPTPIEQMAKVYQQLIIKGTWHTVSTQSPLVLPWEG